MLRGGRIPLCLSPGANFTCVVETEGNYKPNLSEQQYHKKTLLYCSVVCSSALTYFVSYNLVLVEL